MLVVSVLLRRERPIQGLGSRVEREGATIDNRGVCHLFDELLARMLGEDGGQGSEAATQVVATFEEWTPPDGGGFVINATELRSVNFTMTPTTPPPPQLEQVRRSGRRAAVVSAPPPPKPPTEFTMARAVDDDIRSKCW